MMKPDVSFVGLMHFPWLPKNKWATMGSSYESKTNRSWFDSIKHFNTREEAELEMNNHNTIVEISWARMRGFDNE